QGHLVNAGLIKVDPATDRSNTRFIGSFEEAGGVIKGNLYFDGSTLKLSYLPATGQTFLFVGGGDRIKGDIPAGATIWVQGNNPWQHANLVVDHDMVNHGIIRLESVEQGWQSLLTVSTGRTLTNAADGVIAVNKGDVGGLRYVQGHL